MDDEVSPAGQAIDLVLFRWDTFELAFQASQVLALELAGDPDLPTIGAMLGLPDARLAGALRLLRVAGPTGTLCIRVEDPVTQVRLPAAAIHPLPPLLAARLRLPWVRALAFRAGEGRRSLDPETGGRGFSRSTLHPREPAPATASTSSAQDTSDGCNGAQVRRLILILDPSTGPAPGLPAIET